MQVKVIKKIDGRIDRKTGSVFSERARVCAYCRVSTDSEEQKSSYDSQLKYYEDKINSNPNWSFAGIYADEAISGTMANKRDDFMKMIGDALGGKIDLILTKSISRFARNTVDTLKFVRKLKEKNIAIIFEEENINTMEMAGELLLTILSSIAQQESENISTHVKLGLKMKMQRGELVGFNSCYGYRYDRETKTMTIIEKEAEAVRYIFTRYCYGVGAKVISRELEELGYISPRGSTKWSDSTVIGIIKNVKYKGDVLMGITYTQDPITHKRLTNMGEEDQYYIEGHHQPIISTELFEKAQYILESRRKSRDTGRKGSNYSRRYPFSSLLECGFCGKHYVRRHVYNNMKFDARIWECTSFVKKGRKFCPESKLIREEIIQNCFVDAYKLLTNNNKNIIKKFIDRIDTILQESSISKDIEKLDMEKEKLESKLDRFLNLVADGTIDRETYSVNKEEITKKIRKIEKEKNKLSLEDVSNNKIKSAKNKVKTFFEKNNYQLDKFDEDLFRLLIHKVIIGEKTESGKVNPYVINFVFRNGNEYNRRQLNDIELLDEEELLILKFDSFQYFFSFEKQKDGSIQKQLKEKIEVKVTLNK